MNLLHDVKELNNFFEGTKTYDSATMSLKLVYFKHAVE
jgi:hypothetical protein